MKGCLASDGTVLFGTQNGDVFFFPPAAPAPLGKKVEKTEKNGERMLTRAAASVLGSPFLFGGPVRQVAVSRSGNAVVAAYDNNAVAIWWRTPMAC